jgi:hypothetical protein
MVRIILGSYLFSKGDPHFMTLVCNDNCWRAPDDGRELVGLILEEENQ